MTHCARWRTLAVLRPLHCQAMVYSSERRLRQLRGVMCPSRPYAPVAAAAAAPQTTPTVKVGIFGAGGHARRAHAPNLRTLPGVEIVAIADANLELAKQLADDFAPGARCYADGHEMLAAEPELHALFSVVPAFVRAAGVEAAAAAKGIHIFSEKPQTLDMATARGIAAAIEQAGVVSSVGFRERYRPLFRAARDYLAGKEVVHVAFRSFSGVPKPKPAEVKSWHDDFLKMGGSMFDWGCHAVDYVRFMTGEDVISAQAWYNHPEQYLTPLSASVNFLLTNGATMTSTFVSATGDFDRQPWFVIHFVGGTLALYGYERMEVSTGKGTVVEYSAAEDRNPEAPADGYVRGVGYDPWYDSGLPSEWHILAEHT